MPSLPDRPTPLKGLDLTSRLSASVTVLPGNEGVRGQRSPQLSVAGKARSLDYSAEDMGTPYMQGVCVCVCVCMCLCVTVWKDSGKRESFCSVPVPLEGYFLSLHILSLPLLCLGLPSLTPSPDQSVKSSPTADVLFLVFHGGSALDARKDQIGKDIDFQTLSSNFQSITELHFPSAVGRVALRIVPCMNVCSQALELLTQVCVCVCVCVCGCVGV